MKNLSRGGIFYRTIDSFLNKLRKNHKEAFNGIDSQLTSKYLKSGTGYDFFGQVKPSKRERILANMAEDILVLPQDVRKQPVNQRDIRLQDPQKIIWRAMRPHSCLQRNVLWSGLSPKSLRKLVVIRFRTLPIWMPLMTATRAKVIKPK
jgi:hypothetical protein